jgi:ferrochelatase
MSHYLGLTQFEHGSAERLGVLLVNLGTPEAPTPAAVRKFLAEFLWDPRVIETPRWLWWLALHGVILRIRPRKSAHAYQQIWTPAGSPLLLHCRELAGGLQASLDARLGPAVQVALGMTYGAPSIRSGLEQLHRDGVQRLIVLPLYPQYSATTTGSVFDRVTSVMQRWRWLPELRFIGSYHDDPAYIAAIVASIREHWKTHERRHLLLSFHGAPRQYLLAGDPYHCQCLKTARLISESLGLDASEWTAGFQSRLGRGEWLRPYTDELLIRFARQGPQRLTVACPGFATDNLETLEEIAIRNRADFLAQGGESFDYIPALNASEAHVALLADLVARHAQGWQESPGAAAGDPETNARARRAGATR